LAAGRATDQTGGADTILYFEAAIGSTMHDSILGSNGNEMFDGAERNDTINAGGGDDTIVGGDGDDLFMGGAGNDLYLVAAATGNVIIDDEAGNDTVSLAGIANDEILASEISSVAGVDAFDLAGGGDVILHLTTARAIGASGTGLFRVFGSGGDRLIFDDTGWVRTGSSGGFDTMSNSAGNATVIASTGLAPSDIGSVVSGGDGNDTLLGGNGADTIDGGSGSDIIAGFGGSDSILGGDGNDSINGGDGADKLYGGDGTDLLVGKAGNDDLRGGDYNPLLTAHGQVYRLYLAALDREPDEVGFANWVTALANGTTLAGITTGFVNSTEFQARYGVLDNTQFVTLLYNNVLDRAPDSGGLAHWVGALAGGATRESIVNGFSESQELVGNTLFANTAYVSSRQDEVHLGQVYRLYLAALDRAPDEGGFANWVTALANGTTLAGITTGFVNSTEFQARYGVLDNTQFVTLLYNNVLDRAPDSGGLAHWVGALAGGATRESIVNGFSESQELVGNTDLTLVGYMRSISPWRNTLDGGAGDDTLLGGRGVDTFVFDANEDGSDTVYGLDDWDMLRFENFGFNQSSDVFNFFIETNGEAVFSYEGVSITFDNTPLAGIDIGMVLI
jgi:Ca2+-binding RTX toxin-like protein